MRANLYRYAKLPNDYSFVIFVTCTLLKCTCTKKQMDLWKGYSLESIAPTFSEKYSSSNEIIHFKVKGLRGETIKIVTKIVTLKCGVVFSKVLSDPVIF